MEKAQVTIAPLDELTDEAHDNLAHLLAPKFDTSGGLADVRDLLRDCAVFEVSRGAELVGHYALRVDARAHGNEGVIVGAIGRDPAGDGMRPYLTQGLLRTMEAQFTDARAITIYTRRMPLVRALARQGYTCDGFIMRKRVPVHAC